MKYLSSLRWRGILALAFLVPAPSIGVLLGMFFFPGSLFGRLCFGVTKIWILVLPFVWSRWVDRHPVSFSPARRGGFGVGVISGLLISGIIIGTYLLFGNRVLDQAFFVDRLTAVGLADWRLYVAGMIYWVVLNAVLEEYVWRWFCVEQCGRVWKKNAAIVASACFFTLHHILSMYMYFPPLAIVVCTLGVFLGGVIWSAMYVRYGSIWPGYVSHAIVDVAIFGIGAKMLFG